MKKLFFAGIILILSTALCFAESMKYRYCIATETSLLICDFSEPVPKENLSDTVYSLNTKMERLEVEAIMRNVQSFFYSGEILFMYGDYTENPDDPDMCFIDTWSDLIAYIRGTK